MNRRFALKVIGTGVSTILSGKILSMEFDQSIDHVKNVCLHGKGIKGCRYFGTDDVYDNKYYCFKLIKKYRTRIDEEVELLKEGIKNGLNLPLGDNCEGKILDNKFLCENYMTQ